MPLRSSRRCRPHEPSPVNPCFADAITVEELDHDPYPIYARMRREAPVCFVPAVGLWFVTRWADVEYAASHADLFVSRVDPSPLERAMGGDSILLLDGEPQKRLRAMLDPSLRPRVVEATHAGARRRPSSSSCSTAWPGGARPS